MFIAFTNFPKSRAVGNMARRAMSSLPSTMKVRATETDDDGDDDGYIL
jgi:hypothetical protein